MKVKMAEKQVISVIVCICVILVCLRNLLAFLWFVRKFISCCFVGDDSALSEVSLCSDGFDCGTETSEAEEDGPPPIKKRRITGEKGKNTRKSRSVRGFGGAGRKDRGSSQGSKGRGQGRNPRSKGKGKGDKQSSKGSHATNKERKSMNQKESCVESSSHHLQGTGQKQKDHSNHASIDSETVQRYVRMLIHYSCNSYKYM